VEVSAIYSTYSIYRCRRLGMSARCPCSTVTGGRQMSAAVVFEGHVSGGSDVWVQMRPDAVSLALQCSSVCPLFLRVSAPPVPFICMSLSWIVRPPGQAGRHTVYQRRLIAPAARRLIRRPHSRDCESADRYYDRPRRPVRRSGLSIYWDCMVVVAV